MITCGAVPALLPAYAGVSQTPQITIGPDFTDTLGRTRGLRLLFSLLVPPRAASPSHSRTVRPVTNSSQPG